MAHKLTSAVVIFALLGAFVHITDAKRAMGHGKVHLHPKTGEAGSLADISATNSTTCHCDLSRYSFGDRYEVTNPCAGEGANGCVVIAKDRHNDGVAVAIKVSKSGGKLASWKKECHDMQELRTAACSDPRALLLAERYLPTCLDVGGDDGAPYIVMHAAASDPIRDHFGELARTPEGGASVFAQLVGALFSMHGIGFTHNDLHDQNVVILHKDAKLLALIDFGDVKSLEKGQEIFGKHGGYKQDENVLARHAAMLAGCPSAAQYPFNAVSETEAAHQARKIELFKCLQEKWGIDDELKGAFEAVIDEAFRREVASKVPALYNTKWVQEHEPSPESFYPTPSGWCDGSVPLSGSSEPEFDKELCVSKCGMCPPGTHVCLIGAAAGGCSPQPWEIGESCQSACPCEGETPVVSDAPKVVPDTPVDFDAEAECAKRCKMCAKDHHVCTSGPAVGGCSKSAWVLNDQCLSMCHCGA